MQVFLVEMVDLAILVVKDLKVYQVVPGQQVDLDLLVQQAE